MKCISKCLTKPTSLYPLPASLIWPKFENAGHSHTKLYNHNITQIFLNLFCLHMTNWSTMWMLNSSQCVVLNNEIWPLVQKLPLCNISSKVIRFTNTSLFILICCLQEKQYPLWQDEENRLLYSVTSKSSVGENTHFWNNSLNCALQSILRNDG